MTHYPLPLIKLALEKKRRAIPAGAIDWLARVQTPEFPEQNAFVLDPSRSPAALCTRRAGKTNGLAIRFIRTLIKHKGAFCPYLALTRDSAKNIMWGVLQEQAEHFKVPAKFTESNLTMTLDDSLGGGRLVLYGADMQNFITRLKGIKTPGAAIDEAQEFGPHLKQLAEEVLEPTIGEYADGWLAICGTPGKIPLGLYYEITEKGYGGYSLHKWTCYQNPFFPTAREYVESLKRKNKWDDNNPTYQREWLGKWVKDLEALLLKYDPDRNHYDEVPHRSGRYFTVLGVDLGFHDADALSVIGWNEHVRASYLLEERVTAKQGITELVGQIQAAIEKYQPLSIVMDTGGLGKKIAEEITRRFGIPIKAADKARKFENVELMNDAMRVGSFFAKKTSRFAEDAARIEIDKDKTTPDRIVLKSGFHSDIVDATLYAFVEALHWLSEPELVIPKSGTNEWLKRQEREMEEQAVAALTQNQDDSWLEMGFDE